MIDSTGLTGLQKSEDNASTGKQHIKNILLSDTGRLQF
jgi:hypothetical protein